MNLLAKIAPGKRCLGNTRLMRHMWMVLLVPFHHDLEYQQNARKGRGEAGRFAQQLAT